MMHEPISITALSLCFPQKVCFTNFSTQIYYASRIAIIGCNGSGKSTLLKGLHGLQGALEGVIHIPKTVCASSVPQVIEDFDTLSGGQRFNAALTQALAQNPNMLLLDEPTNHLDASNRRSLLRLLRTFSGTLIVVTHDVEILRKSVDTLWHIDQGKICVFAGNYDDYEREKYTQRQTLEKELRLLDQQKKQTHLDLMKEQERSKKSAIRGEKKRTQGHWPTIVAGGKKRQAQEATGRKRKRIDAQKQEVLEKIGEIRAPEIIVPKFTLKPSDVNTSKTILSIQDGRCGYQTPILEGIYLSLATNGRLALTGDNGTGKSTLVRAILNDEEVTKTGDWAAPSLEHIGYLDQHYSTLNVQKTVVEIIQEAAPHWPRGTIRAHLNDFLFRKNEEVLALISTLSGGEKARLSLAQIAAKTPKLLILDEITNNLDLETRAHVIQVLQYYPGALIVISHDEDFLKEIGVQDCYDLNSRKETR